MTEQTSDTSPVSEGRRINWIAWIAPLASLVVFSFAITAIARLARETSWREVLDAYADVSALAIALALVFTVGSYIALTGYDVLAIRQQKLRVGYRTVGLAAFLNVSFSYTIGFALLTGGTIRYRVYSAAGMPAIAVVRIVAFCTIGYTLGLLTVGGMALVYQPDALSGLTGLSADVHRTAGGILLALVVLGLIFSGSKGGRFRLSRWRFDLPSAPMMIMQILVAVADIALAAAALYVLLPGQPVEFMPFLSVFILASVASFLSNVPGGLGVFETIVIWGLPDTPIQALFGALLLFRFIYYILPFMAAVVLLGLYEAGQHTRAVSRLNLPLAGISTAAGPALLGAATFVVGSLILFTGTLPLQIDSEIKFPLTFSLIAQDAAHLAASLIGFMLLIVSRSVLVRKQAGWRVTALLLLTGTLLTLVRGGGSLVEPIICLVTFVILLPARGLFHRAGSAFIEPYNARWIASLLGVLLATIWLGFLVYQDAYTDFAWWEIGSTGDVARFLRASSAVCLAALFYCVWLISRRPKPIQFGGQTIPPEVPEIVAASPRPDASLALLGDKSFLISDDGSTFLMYARSGNTLVALQDPVGIEQNKSDLLWRFRDVAARYDTEPLFFDILPDRLPDYLGLGMTTQMIGERCILQVGDPRHRTMRVDPAIIAQVITGEALAAMAAELDTIKQTWLQDSGDFPRRFVTTELEQLSERGAIAVQLSRGDTPIAVASALVGAESVKLDTLFYTGSIGFTGALDACVVALLDWAAHNGKRTIDLGLTPQASAPSSGLFAALYSIGPVLYDLGEHAEDLDHLRRIKERYDPNWIPVYIACRSGFKMPLALEDLTKLIAKNGEKEFRFSAGVSRQQRR